MDSTQDKQPVACTVCHWESPARLETCVQHWCPGCLAMRWFEAAAVKPEEAVTTTEEARSLERVVRLLARWRERADRLQRMALEYEEEDDDKNAVDCSSAAQEIRDCALDI